MSKVYVIMHNGTLVYQAYRSRAKAEAYCWQQGWSKKEVVILDINIEDEDG